MPERNIFLAPKLEGRRFDNHTIPLEMLEDFSALQDLVFEMARKIYLAENPGRKKVPNGFLNNVNLSISGISEGSSIPAIVLTTLVGAGSIIGNADTTTSSYLNKAREQIIELVSNEGQASNSFYYDEKIIGYFNRFGKNLRDGETMTLNPGALKKKGILTPNIRRNILLSKDGNSEYPREDIFYASVTAINKGNKTFTMVIDGYEHQYKLNPDLKQSIKDAYEEFENNIHIRFKATGIFNRANKLQRIENIDSVDVLDPFDVGLRIHQLKRLKDNWYYGQGVAPKLDFLENFASDFLFNAGLDFPLPAIFPTLDGNLELEWKLFKGNLNLEINADNYIADLLFVSKSSDADDLEFSLDLNDQKNWNTLKTTINELNNDGSNIIA